MKDEDVRRQLDRCDASVMEVDLRQRSQMINKKLGADRRNVELWLQFLALQVLFMLHAFINSMQHFDSAFDGGRRGKGEGEGGGKHRALNSIHRSKMLNGSRSLLCFAPIVVFLHA